MTEREYFMEVGEQEERFPYLLKEHHRKLDEDGEVVGGGTEPIAKFRDEELASKVGAYLLSLTDKGASEND